jgi:hypothetical protein
MALPSDAQDPLPFKGTLQLLKPWKDEPLRIQGFYRLHAGQLYIWSPHYLFSEITSLALQDDGSCLISNGRSEFLFLSADVQRDFLAQAEAAAET